MLRRILLLTLLLLLFCVTPALADAGGGPVAVPETTGCPVQAWGSLPRSAPGMSPGFIDRVRIGQGPCADRIVFDVVGATPGWSARYVSRITEDASGRVLPVPGSAFLLVVVNTNAHNINTGVTTLSRSLPQPTGFRTFKGLVFAGDFEGLTTVGIGVRARLPFRTFSLPGLLPGHNRVVVDVAHTWR
ncbi:MAG TPA: hypothetical protein VJW23_14255 [Propionibacteriaceae bacterium]|nr:hypothetical protein [Propionibacteriaceae bacterium]